VPSPALLWLGAVALYGASWLVLSWPWLSGAVTIPWDAKAHFYPQLQFLAQSLRRGESPFWTPYVFSGSPQIADPQSLIFSPPFLTLAWLDPNPGFESFDAVVLGSLGIGGLFIMLLFRDRAWHPAGALIAALAFAFGASAAWRVQHVGQILSLGMWPVALWLLLRALERRSLAYGFLAGLAAGVMALGRDQVAYLALLTLGLAVLDHLLARPFWRRLGGSIGPLVAGALGGALVVTVPVLLTILLAESSNRPAIDYWGAAKGSLHPALLLTAVIPNLFGADGPFADYWGPPSPLWGPVDLALARNMGVLYIGALPLALVIAGAVRGFFGEREIRVYVVSFAIMLLYALGRYAPVFEPMFLILPGADLFRRPADATFLVGALGAILAGYAAHRVWSGTDRLDRPLPGLTEAAFFLSLVAAGMALAFAKGTLHTAARPIVEASLCWGAAFALLSLLPVLVRRSGAVALLAVGLFVAGDLAWNNGPNESTALPPETYDVLRPESRNETLAILETWLTPNSLDRIELTALGFHWPNASLVHRLHNTLGYNPLRLGAYAEATGAGDHVALPEQRRFSPLFPSYRSPLADLLGLRFIATGVPVEQIDRALKPGDLTFVARTKDGFVYENPRARPRAHFVTGAQEADFDALLKTGRWPNVDLAQTVLLLKGSGAAAPPVRNGAAAPVTIASYRNTEVLVDVEAPQAGWVVLNDPYQPWWRADVDGQDAPLLRANGIVRAVPVPAGRHRVRFTFVPFEGAWQEARRRWDLDGRWRGAMERWPLLERARSLVDGGA
jgi:hypothetical protein